MEPSATDQFEAPNSGPHDDLASALRADHRRIEAGLVDLCERARCGEVRECDEIWERFSADLERHMQFEERHLFPVYARTGPIAAATVAALGREHQLLRARLAQLGIDAQLHQLRADKIESFVAALRVHAALEDRTFHPWLAESGIF